MKVRATTNFAGEICMAVGETRDVPESIAAPLMRCGYLEMVEDKSQETAPDGPQETAPDEPQETAPDGPQETAPDGPQETVQEKSDDTPKDDTKSKKSRAKK